MGIRPGVYGRVRLSWFSLEINHIFIDLNV